MISIIFTFLKSVIFYPRSPKRKERRDCIDPQRAMNYIGMAIPSHASPETDTAYSHYQKRGTQMTPQGNNKRAYDEGYKCRVDNKERKNPYNFTSQLNNMTESWWETGYDKADKHIREMD